MPRQFSGIYFSRKFPFEFGQEGTGCSPRKLVIPRHRVARSPMAETSLRAQLTKPPPQKCSRPARPGRDHRSGRSRKTQSTLQCAWRRQLRRPSRQSPEWEWRAAPHAACCQLFPASHEMESPFWAIATSAFSALGQALKLTAPPDFRDDSRQFQEFLASSEKTCPRRDMTSIHCRVQPPPYLGSLRQQRKKKPKEEDRIQAATHREEGG